MHRFAQKPKQIEFSRPHLKTMVRDAQERESPTCPQDFTPLVVYRTPAVFLPQGWDYGFVCPNCLSYGQWIETGREEDEVVAAPKPKKEAPAFHDETIPLPKRMEMAKDGNLALKLYAAMAQTDCTACGYDCEGYAAALATGKEKDPNLCVPGKEETAEGRQGPPQGHGPPGRLRPSSLARRSRASRSPPRRPTPESVARRSAPRIGMREREPAPLPDDARGPDRPSVELDERPREREADAHPRVAPRRRAVDLAEPLEDVGQLALGNADAVVLHADEITLGLALDPHDDPSVLRA